MSIRHVSSAERSWILYDCANSAFILIITTTLFPLYFKDVAASSMDPSISTAWWGYANAAASLVVAFGAPLIGALADIRGMKKALWSIFVAAGILFTLLLAATGEGHWAPCLAIYMAARVGYAGANLVYDSFLVDVTSARRMDWISASGYAWGYAGSTIPFLAAILLIMKGDSLGLTQPSATRLSFVLTAVWWALLSFPMARGVHQRHAVAPSKSPVRDAMERLIRTLNNIRGHRQAFLFLLAYFFYIDGVDTVIIMATAYGRDAGIEGATLILVILVIQVVAFPFALLYGFLARKTSARTMIFAGITVYIFIVFLAFVLPSLPTQLLKTGAFWTLALLVATSQGGIQALSRSLFGRLIPEERAAEFFGFYNIFGRFAAIMGPFMMALLARLTGETRWGVLSLVLLFGAGALILTRVSDPGSNRPGD